MGKQWRGGAWVGVLAVALAAPGFVRAQAPEPIKPGPEFDVLKHMVGVWDATIKMNGMPGESKGVMTYQLEVGGQWLVSNYHGTFAGQPFSGKGLESYDPFKKKYVNVWVDSMAPTLLVMEGTYDAEKKTLTYTGEGLGMEGKPVKYKSVVQFKDRDTVEMTMSTPGKDGQDTPMLNITYKRKAGPRPKLRAD
jgi:hypothetical protein